MTVSILNRRRVLAGTAAALASPVAAVPALAVPAADPVHAAIRRHREAYEAHDLACDRVTPLEEAAIREGVRPWESYPGMAEARANQEAACEADCDAFWDLATTPPTTMAGAAALARYVSDFSVRTGGCDLDDLEAALGTIADALPALMGEEAAHG